MEQHKIDICAISKKGKGILKLPGYILIYSGTVKDKRAVAAVGVTIAEKYQHQSEDNM